MIPQAALPRVAEMRQRDLQAEAAQDRLAAQAARAAEPRPTGESATEGRAPAFELVRTYARQALSFLLVLR